MRDITIKPALNGFMVRVGCQRLVFNDKEEMVTELRNYLSHPSETETRLLKRSINSKNLGYTNQATDCTQCEPVCAPGYPTEERD